MTIKEYEDINKVIAEQADIHVSLSKFEDENRSCLIGKNYYDILYMVSSFLPQFLTSAFGPENVDKAYEAFFDGCIRHYEHYKSGEMEITEKVEVI